MGNYTGLRFKGIVKKEYAAMIRKKVDDWLEWEDLLEDYPDYPFLHEMTTIRNSSLVPYGHLEFMPDSWEKYGETGNLDFPYRFDENTGIWTFQCSTKQDHVIAAFLRLVVPNLIEKTFHVETYFEYDTHSKLYDLVDGKVELQDAKGIRYKD